MVRDNQDYWLYSTEKQTWRSNRGPTKTLDTGRQVCNAHSMLSLTRHPHHPSKMLWSHGGAGTAQHWLFSSMTCSKYEILAYPSHSSEMGKRISNLKPPYRHFSPPSSPCQKTPPVTHAGDQAAWRVREDKALLGCTEEKRRRPLRRPHGPPSTSVTYAHVWLHTTVRGCGHPVCQPGSQLFRNFCSVIEIREQKRG